MFTKIFTKVSAYASPGKNILIRIGQREETNTANVINFKIRYLSTKREENISLPIQKLKSKSKHERKSHFVDFKQVTVEGGKGGNGAISFLQVFGNPMCGPDGGDGGNGGHVIFEANSNVKSLENMLSQYRGKPGDNGRSKHQHGANAEHTKVTVPVGTFIRNLDGKKLAELESPGMLYVVARGGMGGKGNHYYLSNENRHPRVAEIGADGERLTYYIEMKTIAHVGLVGFPNAGKSTLLHAISRAKPKIAAYPFTTLKPHVGIVHYDDYEQIAVADIPGLIPDAHKNRGLGVSFLKHIERCICLLYVIDTAQDSPWKQFEVLRYELEQYQNGLSTRPSALVANKMDLETSQNNLEELRKRIDIPIFPLSAKEGTDTLELLKYIRLLYDKHNKNQLVW